MTAVIGIDLGTSGVKAVLADDGGVIAEASRKIAVSVPRPGWSEQDPRLWVEAAFACLDDLAAGGRLAPVRAIGLSGQMLGVVLLDEAGRPVRPAMLWNDQRAVEECTALARAVPDIGRRTNGRPDPGLPAPKLLWLARHEPDALARARMLLLPKDYLRLALTGTRATEPTDAGGTQLFDVAAGDWDSGLCAAAGWRAEFLPPVTDSWAAAGTLRGDLARRWGMTGEVPVAAGAGDNMAATLGMGAGRPGEAVVTIGTSGVACLVDSAFHPAPEVAVLTSAHAAPRVFLSMGVVMSATQTLEWLAGIAGVTAAELDAGATALVEAGRAAHAPVMLPALTGVRTPLGRPDLAGRIAGLRPGTDRAMLAYAVMEGVAFQLADCVAAQTGAGVPFDRLAVVGGGARSRLWVRLVATALGRPAELPAMAPVAACLGAARLARVAAGLDPPGALRAAMPAPETVIGPEPGLERLLSARRPAFEALLG